MNTVSEIHGTFGQQNFSSIDLGDARRTKRLVTMTDQIGAHPDKSLPNKFANPAAYRAALRLINSEEVTHQTLLGAHSRNVLQRLRGPQGPEVVLFPEDTTELDFSGQETLCLGSIGNGGGQGYECHNTLAIDPDTREIYGLVDQILHRRPQQPIPMTAEEKRADPDRESRLWVKASQNVGPTPADKMWIYVCDRGADTFEYLEHQLHQGKAFVVRSTQNRNLLVCAGATASTVSLGASPHLLHDFMRSLVPTESWCQELSGQSGQPSRKAGLKAAASEVTLLAPKKAKGEHGQDPLRVWCVRVWEANPPEGAEGVEWILLAPLELPQRFGLRRVVHFYECRPVVEEYHKCQKTGMGIELLQLQSRAGLEPMIALLSVIAVPMVNLRVWARDEELSEKDATELVDPLWVKILSIWRYKEERRMTVLEYTMALGRLGGHQNRKCDGLPGWLTLWRGWERMRTMLDYELARQRCGKH